MCGAYNVKPNPYMIELAGQLRTPEPDERLNLRPGAYGQFVYETSEGRHLQEGIWSLLIERKPDGSGYRPSTKYSTFNARSRSLGTSPLWRKRFPTQRAIIPASAFHEWTGPKGSKQCYSIAPVDSAIAFAGLYEFWNFDGEIVPAYTTITLPPHPRFSHIHDKSIPMMLREEDFDLWLDPTITNTDPFQHLLNAEINTPLRIVPIKSPTNLEPVGEEEILEPDQ